MVKHPHQQTAKVEEPTNQVGIDKGIRHRFALSTGHHIPAREPDRKRIARYQRRASRADKARKKKEKEQGRRLSLSNSRAKKQKPLNKLRSRETDRALHADFRLAHWLVSNHDGIATEILNVAGLMRSGWFSRIDIRPAVGNL